MAGDFPVYGGRDKPLPYKITGTLPNLRRGGPWASRQDSHRERWFGKTRRKNSTASVPIFANPGPSGPAGIQSATQILRAESALPGPRGNPRNGVRGKATMSTKCSSEPSPVAFWFLCRHGQRNSPPAGGEIPCGSPPGRRALRMTHHVGRDHRARRALLPSVGRTKGPLVKEGLSPPSSGDRGIPNHENVPIHGIPPPLRGPPPFDKGGL